MYAYTYFLVGILCNEPVKKLVLFWVCLGLFCFVMGFLVVVVFFSLFFCCCCFSFVCVFWFFFNLVDFVGGVFTSRTGFCVKNF